MLANGPTVERLQSENLENRQVQGALNEIRRLADTISSVTEIIDRDGLCKGSWRCAKTGRQQAVIDVKCHSRT
jgi:hypothetical protein